MIIDGRKISQEVIEELKKQPTPKKILAAVLVDSTRASTELSRTSSPQVGSNLSFLKQKEKIAKELGVDFRIYQFPADLTNDDLRKEVGKIALLKRVGGMIVQLPLPEHINKHYILNVIPREKDVDVLGERALGAFYTGRNPVLPPAVGTMEKILKYVKFNIETSDVPRQRRGSPQAANINVNVKTSEVQKLKVAVVGLGFLVGKPIATRLMGKCAEIYLLDKGSDLSILKQADLVIFGVGKAGLLKQEILKDGATIIDFGYSVDESGKISGDFDTSQLTKQLRNYATIFYTPTPGGTGPILVAQLFENFYKLNG